MGGGSDVGGRGAVGVAVISPWPLAICSVPPLSPVLYDACPKSLRSGVWWPQTKFGMLASVPCPRGALGEYLGGGQEQH